jgi:hypothetical protein
MPQLLSRTRGNVNLNEHSRPDEGGHGDNGAGRLGRAAERLCLAFARLKEIANVRQVRDDLVNILNRRAVLFQMPLNLVPSIAALRAEVADVPHDSALGAGAGLTHSVPLSSFSE